MYLKKKKKKRIDDLKNTGSPIKDLQRSLEILTPPLYL